MNAIKGPVRWDLSNDRSMAQAVQHARIPLCITDPNLPDHPIVFANAAFTELTGYAEDEVLGRNCRFLQGPETTPHSIETVRHAIEARKVETVEIVNYRKNGSAFVNALQLGPIFDDDGNLAFFFGSQLDVTARREAEREARKLANRELLHRLQNIVNVMDVVIRKSAREENDTKVLASKVTGRLRALSDAHFRTIDQPNDQSIELGDLARTILLAYAPYGEEQFDLSGPDIRLPHQLLSCIALGFHELATNSVKHGALGAQNAKVSVVWDVQANGGASKLMMTWRETGGPRVAEPQRQSGSKIVNDIIEAVGGSFDLFWEETGLVVKAGFPLPVDHA